MSSVSASAAGEGVGPDSHGIHKLVLSEHHRGNGYLDRIAASVNAFVGSMWVFVAVTSGIVVWLFAGNVVGFDKTPWPLLLTILNLPQLSIMVSLQVSANLAQRTSDARALTDHNAIIELHKINLQQLELLEGQQKMLTLLQTTTSQPQAHLRAAMRL